MADQTENTEFDADKAREFYGTATNDDLKTELANRGLATSGNKDALVDRLVEDDRARAAAENGDGTEDEQDDVAENGGDVTRAPSATAGMSPEEKDAHIAYLENALTEALGNAAAAQGDGDEERVHPDDDSDICRLCYPQGWPDPQGARVSRIHCEHGEYKR